MDAGRDGMTGVRSTSIQIVTIQVALANTDSVHTLIDQGTRAAIITIIGVVLENTARLRMTTVIGTWVAVVAYEHISGRTDPIGTAVVQGTHIVVGTHAVDR